ncbi:MAG: type II secretion system F family protein [Campylobacterales bacterium]|nr:type II secretion system F family protein [Campylobacterales bacterium]
MIFKYSGIDKNGKNVNSKIEANNLEDAKRRLKAQNIVYKSIKEDSNSIFQNIKFERRYKIPAKELATLSRDLSIYIKSGISIVNAIGLASNQYDGNKKLSLFLKSIKTFLDEGKNFYQALEAQSVITLPSFYKQSIKVSEDSGILDEVLLELSRFLKEQDRINKQVQGAFAYPLFILTVSVFMVAFMIAYVVPKITSIFEQMHQELPAVTKFVISAGDWLSSYWILLLGSILTIIIFVSILLSINKQFKYYFDKFLLKIPFFGKILESSELGRFAYISSILFKSGVPFVQTVNLSSKILKNTVISNVFENASNRIVEGGKLSNALMKSDYLIDKSFMQAIALGEETSEVAPILKNLSELYFEENKDRIEIFLSLLEPFLMLIVGGIIGFIVTSMLLPIFSMNIG